MNNKPSSARHRSRSLAWLSLCLGAWMLSAGAHAKNCPFYPSQPTSQVVDFGTIRATDDIEMGATIASKDSQPAFTTFDFFCAKPEHQPVHFGYNLTIYTTPTSINGVYATNVPGIGIRISRRTDAGDMFPTSYYNTGTSPLGFARVNEFFHVSLVKTGQIESGVVPGDIVATMTADGHQQMSLLLHPITIEAFIPALSSSYSMPDAPSR